ncbi:hypothetical protein BR1R5_13410 [Pseudomonas sp. BR1R-5]|jgi:hypothetical protein|nr:hypothetical protein BR1R5_13410 [Pseudomonas sp. BR1R-5]
MVPYWALAGCMSLRIRARVKKESQLQTKEAKYPMPGITRIHRYLRSLSANRSAASGREVKQGARAASKLADILCTPRSVPPYFYVAPVRGPVDRMPPT